MDKNKYKIKFEAKESKNEIKVKILKVDDDKVCVEFNNLSEGSYMEFLETYKEFSQDVLG